MKALFATVHQGPSVAHRARWLPPRLPSTSGDLRSSPRTGANFAAPLMADSARLHADDLKLCVPAFQ